MATLRPQSPNLQRRELSDSTQSFFATDFIPVKSKTAERDKRYTVVESEKFSIQSTLASWHMWDFRHIN